MEAEPQTNPKTGLFENPIYPCIKGEGLCRIRFFGTPDFQCDPIPSVKYCHYRKMPKEKKDE